VSDYDDRIADLEDLLNWQDDRIAELEEEVDTWKDLAQANSDVIVFLLERAPELALYVEREDVDIG
jgi:uncharacterized coiled-coil protein SlyX